MKKIVFLLTLFLIYGCSPAINCSDPQVCEDINSRCDKPVVCNDIQMIDCGAEVDDVIYYLNATTGDTISLCGGACWDQSEEIREKCRNLCPPPSWACS